MRLALLAIASSACSLYTGHDHRAPPGASTEVTPPDATTDVTGPKRVFVTSTTYAGGALGGLDGADAKCAARAAAVGLAGTYKAWLSTSAASAASRLTHSSAQYHLVDGTPIAASWNDLVGGALLHPIDLDETGAPDTRAPTCMSRAIGVWTGTVADGTTIAFPGEDDTCVGWTSITAFRGLVGTTDRADAQWTDSGCASSCDMQAALYCFEQ